MAQNHFYALLLSLSAILSLIILIYSCYLRTSPGSIGLIVNTSATLWWALTYAIHWTYFAGTANSLWLDLTYLGVVIVPAGFFMFSGIFTDRFNWLLPRRSYLLFIEPAITIILLFTDSFHGLFFGAGRVPGSNVILNGGIWYRVNVVYQYSLIAISIFFLVGSYLRSSRLQKRQTGIFLAGSVIPLASNVLVVLNLSPLPDLDLTPIAFSLTSLVYAYGLFWYRILDIIPVARNLVIETMADGVMVLDGDLRIVDVNQSVFQLLHLTPFEPRGQHINQILPGWGKILEKHQHNETVKEIFEVDQEGSNFVELQITSLNEDKDIPGHVVVIRDISERVISEKKLKQSNLMLNIQLEKIAEMQEQLREQANRDPLTGLFNRRYFDKALNQEICNANQNGEEISLILCDIDHFKEINDQYGHLVGDSILQNISIVILSTIRDGDIACRLGGDEFIIVLPLTNLYVAENRAVELIKRISTHEYSGRESQISIQVSVGVVSYPKHGSTRDELFHGADMALYQAKSLGRNQVVVYQPEG